MRDARGQSRVLKTLRPEHSDQEAAAALAHEEWLARRVNDAWFPQVISPGAQPPVLPDGLARGRHPQGPPRGGHRFRRLGGVSLGACILKGLAGLHRLSIVLGTSSPTTCTWTPKAACGARSWASPPPDGSADGQQFEEINNPGTPATWRPSSTAPRPWPPTSNRPLRRRRHPYELLTRKYPYGEIEPFQHPSSAIPYRPTRYRPDIPAWLEAGAQAVAREPKARFETAEEFLLAPPLEQGAHPLAVPRKSPLLERDPQLGLKLLAAALSLLNLLLLYLMLVR